MAQGNRFEALQQMADDSLLEQDFGIHNDAEGVLASSVVDHPAGLGNQLASMSVPSCGQVLELPEEEVTASCSQLPAGVEIPSLQKLNIIADGEHQQEVVQEVASLPNIWQDSIPLPSSTSKGDAPLSTPVNSTISRDNGHCQPVTNFVYVETSVSEASRSNSNTQSQEVLLAYKRVADRACQDNELMQYNTFGRGVDTLRRKYEGGVLTRSRARSADVTKRDF